VNYWPSTQENTHTSPESKEAKTIDPTKLEGHRVKQVGLHSAVKAIRIL